MKNIKNLLNKLEQGQASSKEQGQTISKDNLKNLKGGGWGYFKYFDNPNWGCNFCPPDDSDNNGNG